MDGMLILIGYHWYSIVKTESLRTIKELGEENLWKILKSGYATGDVVNFQNVF